MVTRPPLLPSNKSMLSFRWQRPWETRRGILAGKMGTACPFGIVRLDPTQEERCMEKTYKVSNFEAVSAMESKKAGGGVLLETQVAFSNRSLK